MSQATPTTILPPTQAPLDRALRYWLAVFIGAMFLFSLTAARTILWQDYGHFTLRIVEGELFNELGLALAHPLHFWLGRLFVTVLPVEPAHAVALVSALAGALTIANLFGCVLSLTRRLDAALLAAVSLALSNTFWRMSTMPECYTVTTALLSAELWCLSLYFRSTWLGRVQPGWLMLAILFNGLGLANHNLALLTMPILGVVLLHALGTRRVSVGQAALACCAGVVGASPYIALVVIQAVESGDAAGAIRSALFGKHYADKVMNVQPSLKLAAISVAFTGLSFFNLTLPLAAVGLWRVVSDRARRGLWLAWVAALLIHLLFVMRYNVIDQHTFLLPAYVLIALFAGVGYARLAQRMSLQRVRVLFITALVLVLLAPAVYVTAATLARSRQVLGEYARNKPYRDDYRYLFVPWGAGETSAKQMAEHATRLAGDEGVVIAGDMMASFAIIYTAEREGRTSLEVISKMGSLDVDWPALKNQTVVYVPASETEKPIATPVGTHWRADGPLYVLEQDSADDTVQSESP